MDVKSFLAEDCPAAFKESMCIMDCIYVMRQELVEGDYEQAIVATENALRSFKQLHKMQQEKAHSDEVQAVIQEAKEKGKGIIVIQSIQRLLNG
ncbi:hypothetical protein [Siminovitchia terrae]|uniref:hypothetical protein n=1 Tax=Siminovitchia terrae TaxID=1914933 RepID=UPI0028ADFC8E|nr:hypothetical protein [Siminovitchia terrae]